MEEKKVTGYLYTIRNGRLKKYKGVVEFFGRWERFESEDKKRYQVSSKEGEVYNAVVWFKEPNKEKAVNALLNYEQLKISELEEKIYNHEVKKMELEKFLDNTYNIFTSGPPNNITYKARKRRSVGYDNYKNLKGGGDGVL